MAKQSNKFYAVRIGKKTGIFETWAECQEQVKGYSGAEFSGFKTKSDALEYLNGDNHISTLNNIQSDYVIPNLNDINNKRSLVAYVDGSYDDNKKVYSCGVVLFLNSNKVLLSKKSSDPELLGMRNVAGELMGSMMAMQYASENKELIDEIVIYHDYEGIAKWCTGEWKANKKGTQDYRNFYKQILALIKIKFIKVQAHSGNRYNEEADKLAKKALFDTSNDVNIIKSNVHITNDNPNITKSLLLISSKSKKVKSTKPIINIKTNNNDIKIEDVISMIRDAWRKKKKERKFGDIISLTICINISTKQYEWEIKTAEATENGSFPIQ